MVNSRPWSPAAKPSRFTQPSCISSIDFATPYLFDLRNLKRTNKKFNDSALQALLFQRLLKQEIDYMLNDICRSCTAFDQVEQVGKYKGLCPTCQSIQKRMENHDEKQFLRSEAGYGLIGAAIIAGISVLFYLVSAIPGSHSLRLPLPLWILTNLFGESAIYISIATMAFVFAILSFLSFYKANKVAD